MKQLVFYSSTVLLNLNKNKYGLVYNYNSFPINLKAWQNSKKNDFNKIIICFSLLSK